MERMARPEDVRLGQLLIRKRWCTLRQINDAFAAQEVRLDEGKVLSLGSVLVIEGLLDVERLKAALAELGALRLVCPSCRREQPVSSYQAGAVHACPKCDVTLVLGEELGSESARGAADKKTVAGPAPASEADDEAGSEDTVLGKVVGGCQILERIARGGMGVVYKARQLKLGRTVAVKVLSEELARDRKYVHRFLQEAQSAAELNHGNIVHIIDVGELNSLFYIIMEYVDGSNLREILDVRRVLEPARVVEIALQASQALNHAHKRGVIHRDIKPENIMITREGVVKIADLGLAKKIHPDNQDGGITQTKAIMGTPYYMAPEQIKDFRQVDGRTDIYSLGVTLYRALTGCVPFEGRTPVEVMIKVVDGEHPSISSIRPGIPTELETLVDSMMEKDPAARPESFVEVMRGLDRVLQLIQSRRGAKATASP